MADRDYRVTYRTREVDRGGERDARRRVPGALDPYLYPDDRDEMKRSVALARVRASRYDSDDRDRDFEISSRRETIRDDVSNSTARPGATKTTYSVNSAGVEKESEVTLRSTTKGRESTVATSSPAVSRRTELRERDEVEVDRERTSTLPIRTSNRASAREYDRESLRTDPLYEIQRPRKENGLYVIDARDADVYISGGGRDSARTYEGYKDDVYDSEYRSRQSRNGPTRESDYRQSEVVYSSRDDYQSSAPLVNSGTPYMSGGRLEQVPSRTALRSQTYLDSPSRSSTKVCEDDRKSTVISKGPSKRSTRREEDDFAFVEKRDTRAPTIRETFRDPVYDGPPSAAPETPRGRTRASMVSMSPSEDEYVMVSPPQQRSGRADTGRASSTGTALRSAIYRTDAYTEDERRERRRSRSISFRAHEADDHYAGDRYHQPPGEEAAACGKFLNSYGGQRDEQLARYSSRGSVRDDGEYGRRSRSSKMEEFDYEKKDLVKYEPGPELPKGRSRSRKSRRRRSSDEESYVSRNVEKTIKTTYY